MSAEHYAQPPCVNILSMPSYVWAFKSTSPRVVLEAYFGCCLNVYSHSTPCQSQAIHRLLLHCSNPRPMSKHCRKGYIIQYTAVSEQLPWLVYLPGRSHLHRSRLINNLLLLVIGLALMTFHKSTVRPNTNLTENEEWLRLTTWIIKLYFFVKSR